MVKIRFSEFSNIFTMRVKNEFSFLNPYGTENGVLR
jgi:hypothetical protein